MAHKSETEMIEKTHNTARFFTENRHVSWVLLIGTILWGIYGYMTMPKRKDPDIPVRAAVAIASWPGATAENVEDRVTRVVEHALAENSKIEKLESTTRAGVAVVTISLDPSVEDTAKEFDDIWLKLKSLEGLPDGASLQFEKDFGDTSALMLTVASPRAGDVELELRARDLGAKLRHARALSPDAEHATLVACFPQSVDLGDLAVIGREYASRSAARGAEHVRVLSGPGYFAIDAQTRESDDAWLADVRGFLGERVRSGELHPDLWPLTVVRDLDDLTDQLRGVAGERYSYRELDRFTDQLEKALQSSRSSPSSSRSFSSSGTPSNR